MTAEYVRTPEERFRDLSEYPFAPNWFMWQGLRIHYIDEGSGPAVVLFHGEPTWSYLWRKPITALVSAGFRAVAPDFLGFGKSDKPTEAGFYSYRRHTAAARALIDALDVEEATAVVHDWGGPIGLRVAVESGRFNRLVLLDTGLYSGGSPSPGFTRWRRFVEENPDLPVDAVMRNAATTDWPASVYAAYQSPFPDPVHKVGAWRFPLLVPMTDRDPGAVEMRRVSEALRHWERPAHLLWGKDDPIIPPAVAERFAALIPGAGAPVLVAGAGHFLQEDRGAEVAEHIVKVVSKS